MQLSPVGEMKNAGCVSNATPPYDRIAQGVRWQKSVPLHRGAATFQIIAVIAISIVGAWLARSFIAREGPNAGLASVSLAHVQSSPIIHPVMVNPGPPTPRVDTGVRHPDGSAVTVSCSTCHSGRAPNPENRTSADLNEFHQASHVEHGSITCLSCHNGDNYDQLKLADGTGVEFPDVMRICAQCHGVQTKDYEHGVHGGMNGYWDLSRGPRVRNNCIDCHHPHQPHFPPMRPTFKPHDRFLSPQRDTNSRDDNHDP